MRKSATERTGWPRLRSRLADLLSAQRQTFGGSPPERRGRVTGRGNELQAAVDRRRTRELEYQRQALEQQNGALAALLETSSLLSTDLDQQDDLLERVLDGARRLLRADEVTLWLYDPATHELRLINCTASIRALKKQGVLPANASLVGKILLSGRPYRTAEIQEEPAWANKEYVRLANLHGYLGVPLVVYGEAIGLMSILTHERRLFSDHEVELARSFAGQAAVAISNSRLYEQARRRARRLAEMNQLGALVVSSLDPEEVAHRIVLAGERLLSAQVVRLWLLDESGRELRLKASSGPRSEQLGKLDPLPVDASVFGRAVRERRALHLDNVLADPELQNREAFEREGLRRCLAAPLLQDDAALGVLTVAGDDQNRFEPEDLELLQTLASFAALALENARLAQEVGRLEGLRQLDRLKTEFVSTISHELRTPLAYVHGYAELLSGRHVESQRVREMAAEIHQGSSRMIRMVNDLLDFSRLESGQLALCPKAVDLGALLDEVGRQLVGESPTHSLVVEVPPELPSALADPDSLRQVITSLVSNALRYSNGGVVTLRARLDGGRLLAEVQDQGIGIPPEEQERIFERFYRSRDTLVSSLRGSGLGLAVARHLLDAQGGTLALTNSSHQGSTFSFRLPISTVSAASALPRTGPTTAQTDNAANAASSAAPRQ